MSEVLHERVKWDLQDGVARITLADGSGNALDLAMSRGIREAAERVARGAAEGKVRVAVLAAEGPRFSVGGDLRDFATASAPGDHVRLCADELHQAILTLTDAAAPVVSIIHGTVAGGGIGIALAADIVVVAADAKIRAAYTAAGLSPDCGVTWVLARRLGTARALDLALTNRTLTGTEAAEWGLVSRAVQAHELDQVAEQIIAGLRSGPAGAYAQTKRLMLAAAHRDLATQLDDEAATVAKQFVGPEGAEGVRAFLEKRTPSFS
ncbi:enoyl-CoA hydratase/isomerase family protein [Rhodococcus koreensis]